MKPSHSGTLRIASNYARLMSTFLIGIFVVRMLLRFGDDAYGLIALLGTGTGLALIFKEVVRTSTVPVLGEAFHSDRENWFEEVYNSSLIFSLAAGLATLAIFGVFALCLPLLKFPEELYTAALVFVAASAIQSFFTVIVAPLINFYVVSERMVAYNIFLCLERVGDILAAIVTLLVIGVVDTSNAIMTYGICVAAFCILLNCIAAGLIIKEDSRLVPSLKRVTRESMRTFLHSAGWNSCVTIAMNLYARVDMLIMNLFFGLIGNTVFSIANQAVAYMRQLIIGLVVGVDAVASRVSKTDGDSGVVKLLTRSTSLQAMVVFPTMLVLLIFAEPLVQAWLTGRLENPATTIPLICWLMRILVFGVGARCLSEGWMSIMNGAGKVKKYAPVVLVGGIMNPILAYIALKLAPESYRFAVPAIVFSVLLFSVHLIAIPIVVSREYKLKFFQVVGPMGKPAATAGCSLAIAYVLTAGVPNPLISSVAFGLAFAAIYVVAGYFVLLSQDDRARVSGLVNKISFLSKNGANG